MRLRFRYASTSRGGSAGCSTTDAKSCPICCPNHVGRPCFPYRGHASGEGMFNLLTVVLPRRKVIFAEMLQDCHDLEVGSPIFERLRLPTTAMRRRNDRSNTSTTCGI